MKIIFKDLSKEISDALISDLARNLCIPAFYEFALRARKKKNLGTKLNKLHKYIIENGLELQSLAQIKNMPINKLKAKSSELTLIHPNVYEAPVRSLGSVFNSQKINTFIFQERAALKISHITKGLNKNNFRFTNYESKLTNREISSLKASFLFLNWLLIKRTYKRPNVNFIRYLCSNNMVNLYVNKGINGFVKGIGINKNNHFLKLKLDKQEIGINFLRLYSNELGLFINSLSNEKLSTLIRLYGLSINLSNEGLIEPHLLEKLPIFTLLNKRNVSMFNQLERLYKLGYTRIIHLKFLEKECIDLMQNKKLIKLIRDSSNH